MGDLERLWAGWRMPYVTEAAINQDKGEAGGGGTEVVIGIGDGEKTGDDKDGCVFCAIGADSDRMNIGAVSDRDVMHYVLWRGEYCFCVLNAYPYASGHMLIMPIRHVAGLEEVVGDEALELWGGLQKAIVAIKKAYKPEGLNVGANLGRAGGAGIPGHVHLHLLPRWCGDTNFMTAVAGVRVMPECLDDTYKRLREVWE
ncbi:MAG: HIT domain-containing protein [Actinobacteria bacterium]|nr:HIT domain-containing protein [Actinomycetota bacterium]MCL6105520.1 HIT domain-containing protein [Actinomycetota bacterium]